MRASVPNSSPGRVEHAVEKRALASAILVGANHWANPFVCHPRGLSFLSGRAASQAAIREALQAMSRELKL
eukprot:6149474-Pleurochrysis_carterae.AAC.3